MVTIGEGEKLMNQRIKALRAFGTAITILNILGHTILGFEQSLAQVFTAVFTAYLVELIIEFVDSKVNKRKPAYHGGLINKIDFLIPAHISGLAIGMLLFANNEVLPFAFAASLAIVTKTIFQVNIQGKKKHFLNPSNTGIAVTLLLFPWISIAPPYHFAENIQDEWDIILPLIILMLGSMLNIRLTKKGPLIIAWLGGFVIQALIRSIFTDISLIGALLPMTGMAFLLFTFYMITDPGTTPVKTSNQIIFGFSVAIVYGILMNLHVVFTLFFSLFVVCLLRGCYHFIKSLLNHKKEKLKECRVCAKELPL